MALRTVLDLSTGHLPSSEPDFGKVIRALEYKYGFVVFVNPGALSKELPLWLRPIHKQAKKDKAMLIVFDRDGETDARFKVYDW